MKALVVVIALVVVCQGGYAADQLSQGQSGTSGSGYTQSMSSKHPVALQPIAPRETGVLVDLYKRGPVILSPFAPAKEGMGGRYLSASPSPIPATSRRSSFNASPYDGIRLFGWEF